MDRPFDPAVKTLAELAPADWLPLVGRRRRRLTAEDGDVGIVISGAADKLFRVHDDPEYLLHLDFESGHFRRDLPMRLRLYNSVFEYRHDRVVLSVSVLLCPQADSPQWTGLLQRGFPGKDPLSTLRYQVVRVWQLHPERLLAGGVGTLALAPVSAVPEGQVKDVVQRMKRRLTGPKAPAKARDIMIASYMLLGLRYSDEMAHALFGEIVGMEESSTYQAIVRKGLQQGLQQGRIEEAREVVLLQGEARFGPPDDATREAINAMSDLGQLHELLLRLANTASWQELVPRPRRRNGRRRTSS
jgi:predicted transposase YdaD